jgi:hypothetical protein
LTIRPAERPVIVFHGGWQYRRANDSVNAPRSAQIEIYGQKLDPGSGAGGGVGGMDELAENLGNWIGKRVAIEASGAPSSMRWRYNNNYADGGDVSSHAHDVELVCNNIARQTGLTWAVEQRLVPLMFVERGK